MILIGQYDSPFVRRVGIALHLYGMAYEHRPWSVFGDAEQLALFNPLRRVPTLVLDDGEALIESAAILDHLDEVAGPGKALIADSGPNRRHALKICALATGCADKAVSLFYERALHQQTSERWVERCELQIGAVLDVLETDRAGRASTFWFGEAVGHADIAVACAWRFLNEAHPALLQGLRWPSLAELAGRCERLDVFQAVMQPFSPPS